LAVSEQDEAQSDRDGFVLPWTPDDFIEAGFGSTTAAPLWQFYEWRPGVSREQFLRAIDLLVIPPDPDVREALLVTVWQPHRERMLSMYSTGARTLWSHAERMGPLEVEDRFSRGLMDQSEKAAGLFTGLQRSAVEDVRVMLEEVKRYMPNDAASDVDFVFALEMDRLLREQMLRRSTKGAFGAGGVGVDVAQWVRDANPEAILKPEVRVALERWFSQSAPLRAAASKAAAERGAVTFAIRCPDEAVVEFARRRMSKPELRENLIALRERLVATLVDLDVLLSLAPDSSLVRRLDAIAFPESFPDPACGECVCLELTSGLIADFSAAPESVRKTVARLCAGISAADDELRGMEWEDALLSASDGDVRRRQALDVENARKVLVERRKLLNAELREALRACLPAATYGDIIGRLDR